jgi:hypothetical protein
LRDVATPNKSRQPASRFNNKTAGAGAHRNWTANNQSRWLDVDDVGGVRSGAPAAAACAEAAIN